VAADSGFEPWKVQVWREFGTPPSTRMQLPVMNAAASESRNTTAAETSDSVPKRCSGTTLRRRLSSERIEASYLSSPLEAIQPGATALTRIPLAAHSQAAVSVKFSIPARAAPEWPMPGMPFHMSAIMLTIAPPCSPIQRR